MKKPNYRDKIDDFPRDIQAIKQLDDLLFQLAVSTVNLFSLFTFLRNYLILYKNKYCYKYIAKICNKILYY